MTKATDNWEVVRQRQSQVRETNPASNKLGNKARASSQSRKLGANQPARPLLSGSGWQQELAKQRDRGETDEERKGEGVSITQKHLTTFSSASHFEPSTEGYCGKR